MTSLATNEIYRSAANVQASGKVIEGLADTQLDLALDAAARHAFPAHRTRHASTSHCTCLVVK